MTDNEKRAHDLAIAYVPFAIEEIKKEAQSANISEVSFTFYEMYLQAYHSFLEDLNDDFPEST